MLTSYKSLGGAPRAIHKVETPFLRFHPKIVKFKRQNWSEMPPEPPIDPAVVARNIRTMRATQGLTRRELAERAGITEVTLYHAENGKPLRRSTLKRIAEALNHNLDELTSKRSPILTKHGDFVVHRGQEAIWYGGIDSSRPSPTDRFEHIQESQERSRLGRNGLVPMFYSTPNFVMAEGPGVTLLELFHDYTGFNSRLYEHAIVYCLRGRVRISLDGLEEPTLLEQWDAFGYNNDVEMTFGPAEPVNVGELPPLVMWIGAVRKGRAPE